MITLVPSSFSSLAHSLFITWLCLQVWLTVLGYCGIQDPRIACRLRPRILPAESRELLDHNHGLPEDKNVCDFKRRWTQEYQPEHDGVWRLWPTLPSHLLPRSDLIASLLVQYDTNPWNLIVFNVTFIPFVEYVQLYFYSKLKESLKPFFQRHARSKWNINVAIQFYRWIKVYFRLFKTHYHTLDYHTPKQR